MRRIWKSSFVLFTLIGISSVFINGESGNKVTTSNLTSEATSNVIRSNLNLETTSKVIPSNLNSEATSKAIPSPSDPVQLKRTHFTFQIVSKNPNSSKAQHPYAPITPPVKSKEDKRIDQSTEEPENDNASLHDPPLIVKETEKDVCVDIDVRLCLRRNCKWHSAQCDNHIHGEAVKSIAPFPVAVPKNVGEAWGLLKKMWYSPIPFLLEIFLYVFVAIVIAVALGIVVACWTVFKNVSMKLFCSCISKNGHDDDDQTRRINLTMPEGRRHHLDDYVIDCSGRERTRTQRIYRNQQFRTFQAPVSRTSRPNDLWIPRTSRSRENLERPQPKQSPSWPYQAGDDDDSGSIVTATISRRPKPSSSRYDSVVASENREKAVNVGGSHYMETSFITLPPVVDNIYAIPKLAPKTQRAELQPITETSHEYEVAVGADEEEPCHSHNGTTGSETQTVIMAVDETESTISSSSRTASKIDESTSFGMAEGSMYKRTEQKYNQFKMKLLKVTPPTVPGTFKETKDVMELDREEDGPDESSA